MTNRDAKTQELPAVKEVVLQASGLVVAEVFAVKGGKHDVMEDRYLVVEHTNPQLSNSKKTMLAVADGTGGNNAFDPLRADVTASALAAQIVVDSLKSSDPGLTLETRLKSVNQGLIDSQKSAAAESRLVPTMATLAVIETSDTGEAQVAVVGDASVVIVRANGEVMIITQKPDLETLLIGKGVNAGLISDISGRIWRNDITKDDEVNPYFGILRKYISVTSAMGNNSEKAVFGVHTEQVQLKFGDLVVVCSDGVGDIMTPTLWGILAKAYPNQNDFNRVLKELYDGLDVKNDDKIPIVAVFGEAKPAVEITIGDLLGATTITEMWAVLKMMGEKTFSKNFPPDKNYKSHLDVLKQVINRGNVYGPGNNNANPLDFITSANGFKDSVRVLLEKRGPDLKVGR